MEKSRMTCLLRRYSFYSPPLLFALLLSLASCEATPPEEYPTTFWNGGFESGAKGWTLYGGASVVTSTANSGTRSLKLLPVEGNESYAEQSFDLENGASSMITISYAAKCESTDNASICEAMIAYIDGNGAPIPGQGGGGGSVWSSFRRSSVSVSIPVGAARAVLKVYCKYDGFLFFSTEPVYIDDVTVSY
jgi:hypothetical protein